MKPKINPNRDAPRSPATLDEKILAYARQNAPSKAPRPNLWRNTGLAAASLAAVAVLIASPELLRSPGESPAETASAANSAPTGARGEQLEPSALADAAAPPVASAPAIVAKLRAKKRTEDRERSQNSAVDKTATFAGQPAPAMTAQSQLSELHHAELDGASIAARSPRLGEQKISDTALRWRLRQLQKLSNYDASGAQFEYQLLRHSCLSCDYPGTLEAALERYLNDGKNR